MTTTTDATPPRLRTPLLIGLVVVAAVALFTVVAGRPSTAAPLDPDNTGRSGAEAVRSVLEQQGVEVTVVRSAGAFDDASVDDDTTVLVTSAHHLGRSTVDRLLQHGRGGDLVVADPPAVVARQLGAPESLPAFLGGPVVADCTDPLFDGLRLDVRDGTAYSTGQGCFGVQGGFLLARADRGVALLGASTLLANDAVTDGDNAAVALRLLGRHHRLVWYVADVADVAPGEGVGIGELVPPWVRPALWLLAVTVVGLMLWRGRRLGPLVTEPLPVTVSAIESTRSRGRLYRKARDRAHAAAVLRGAARDRLAARLALPTTGDPAALAATLAQQLGPRLGRPIPELLALLDPHAPPPAHDRDLVELGSRLDALDREVRTA
jgi:Domain of unknown function (DUF4350)